MGINCKGALLLSAAIAALGLDASAAQARHYRSVTVLEDVAPVCTVAGKVPPYIYPAPNWGPFFRHHYYRYGPTPTCILSAAPVVVSQPVISVRY